jgi:hypothetical protein
MLHDNGYRLLFSHREMVADLLKGFVSEAWMAQCDLNSLERANSSFVANNLTKRDSDMIWRMRVGDDHVYLLVEFQSTIGKYMALRIASYQALLYQDLISSGYMQDRKKLPFVLPIVIHNGTSKWQSPLELNELVNAAPVGLDQYESRGSYLLLDLSCFEQLDVAKKPNFMTALIQLENSKDVDSIVYIVSHLNQWLIETENWSLRDHFTVWINRVLLVGKFPNVDFSEFSDLNEVITMLAETIESWTKTWLEQGKLEGKLEGELKGELKGEIKLLLIAINAKFGEVTDKQREQIMSSNPQQIEAWIKLIFQASSVDELLLTQPA